MRLRPLASAAVHLLAGSMTMARAERCHGMRQIARLNWPFYAAAGAVLVPAPLVIQRLPRGAAKDALTAACAAAAVWTLASLVVSSVMYDRSRLMTASWVREALGYRPRRWLNIHAGLDELTPALRANLRGTRGRTLDIFDPVVMTEPSIARARAAYRSGDSEPADFRHLPADTGSADAVFLLLAAHELRSHQHRCALLREVHRVLQPAGFVLVAEHLRNVTNALAFGPGALYFHSRRAWARSFADAGFGIYDEFSITPFVRVFVLRRLPCDEPNPGHQRRLDAQTAPRSESG